MRNVTGQVVRGGDFFDRDADLARLWADLDTDNLMLLAPRRVGKTSVLGRMRDLAEARGYTAVYTDVSDAADEAAFVQRLYEAVLEGDSGNGLWNKIKDSWLGSAIRRVKKVGGAGFTIELDSKEVTWHRLGRELAEALSQLEGRWLLQVDELPVFTLKLLQHGAEPDRARVREFFYWMRRLRLETPEVRWILAGSIGLDTVAARLKLSDAINDLRITTLGAYDDKTAHQFLIALGASYEIDLAEAVRQRVIDCVGWPIPYYLQLIFHELRDRPSKAPTLADVDQAFERLLSPARKSYFDFWRQRLHDELGHPDSGFALGLLNAICRPDDGVSRDVLSQHLAAQIADADARQEKLSYLLDVLESDGYLVNEGNRWRFRFPLLRDFWRARTPT